MNKKLIHAIWIGTVAILTLAGAVLGLRSGNVTVYDREYVWSVEPGEEQELLVRGRSIGKIAEDAHKLLFAFNRTFEEDEAANLREGETALELPRLQLDKLENEVAEVVVVNSDYLTQRMGSAGAQDYLAAATYTLTECPTVQRVSFLFPAGEHAVPGVYGRASFEGYRIIFVKK
jgi:hypothetical protein